MRKTPKHKEAGNNKNIGTGVKNAIPKSVYLEIFYVGDRIPVAQHMVPLQELMENDSIKKPSEAEPKQYSRGGGEATNLTCVDSRPPLMAFINGRTG